MTVNFLEYVERKDRENKNHLDIIKQILANAGFKVLDETKRHHDPFIYVFAPENNLSFEGIRVYPIGNTIAFRCQKSPQYEPFGTSYAIDVERIFENLVGDHKKDEELGKEIMKAIVEEVKLFFKRSYIAERGLDNVSKSPLDAIMVRAQGGVNSYGANSTSVSDDAAVGGTSSGL